MGALCVRSNKRGKQGGDDKNASNNELHLPGGYSSMVSVFKRVYVLYSRLKRHFFQQKLSYHIYDSHECGVRYLFIV